MAITSGATPHRLYLMQVATMYAGDQAVPVPCYLIQLGDGTNILVDSGFPAAVESDAEMQAEMRFEVDKDVVARLADLGLRPDDIDIVICTHLDPDHAGQHAAFARAEFVAQREHDALARGDDPRFEVARPLTSVAPPGGDHRRERAKLLAMSVDQLLCPPQRDPKHQLRGRASDRAM